MVPENEEIKSVWSDAASDITRTDIAEVKRLSKPPN